MNVSVALLSMQGQKALGFYQKYLNSCYEDKRRSYMFRTTWARVINDRIFIFAELFLLVVAKNICVFMSFQMSFFFSWMWEAFASLTVWFQVFPHALTFKMLCSVNRSTLCGLIAIFFSFFFFKHFISNNWKNGHFNVPKVWNDSSICVVKLFLWGKKADKNYFQCHHSFQPNQFLPLREHILSIRHTD